LTHAPETDLVAGARTSECGLEQPATPVDLAGVDRCGRLFAFSGLAMIARVSTGADHALDRACHTDGIVYFRGPMMMCVSTNADHAPGWACHTDDYLFLGLRVMIQRSRDLDRALKAPRVCRSAGCLQDGCRSIEALWPAGGRCGRGSLICRKSIGDRSRQDGDIRRQKRHDSRLSTRSTGRLLPGRRWSALFGNSSEGTNASRLMAICGLTTGIATHACGFMEAGEPDGRASKTTTYGDTTRQHDDRKPNREAGRGHSRELFNSPARSRRELRVPRVPYRGDMNGCPDHH